MTPQSHRKAPIDWKAHRKAARLTMRQAADKCGITYTTLARIENGTQEPSDFVRHMMERIYRTDAEGKD